MIGERVARSGAAVVGGTVAGAAVADESSVAPTEVAGPVDVDVDACPSESDEESPHAVRAMAPTAPSARRRTRFITLRR